VLDGLKDFYFGLEDGYYAFLDKLQEHIPIYSIVDPIDKVIPSFLLLLILIIIGIAGLAFLFLGAGFG